jgi:hypothetical protein
VVWCKKRSSSNKIFPFYLLASVIVNLFKPIYTAFDLLAALESWRKDRAIWTCEGSRKNVDLHLTYKIKDIVFPIHGPHKGIKSINIQRKNNNYIEYIHCIWFASSTGVLKKGPPPFWILFLIWKKKLYSIVIKVTGRFCSGAIWLAFHSNTYRWVTEQNISLEV